MSMFAKATQAAQAATQQRRTNRKQRTNQEMILVPVWRAYPRGIGQALRAALPAADGRFTAGQTDALDCACGMLTGLAHVVAARRQAQTRPSKAARARHEALCVLSDQVGHALQAAEKAQYAAAAMDDYSYDVQYIRGQIATALRELPKLDQMAAVAVHLGHDKCLDTLIRRTPYPY